MSDISGSPGARVPPPRNEGDLIDRINVFELRFTLIEEFRGRLDAGVRTAQDAPSDLDKKIEHFATVGDMLS